MHFHAGAVFSGVIYLDLPAGAGGLEFLKPFRTSGDSLFKTEVSDLSTTVAAIDVRTGDMCVFNSELMHRARSGAEEQKEPVVAVAFDVFSSTDMRNVTGGLPHARFLRDLSSLAAT